MNVRTAPASLFASVYIKLWWIGWKFQIQITAIKNPIYKKCVIGRLNHNNWTRSAVRCLMSGEIHNQLSDSSKGKKIIWKILVIALLLFPFQLRFGGTEQTTPMKCTSCIFLFRCHFSFFIVMLLCTIIFTEISFPTSLLWIFFLNVTYIPVTVIKVMYILPRTAVRWSYTNLYWR